MSDDQNIAKIKLYFIRHPQGPLDAVEKFLRNRDFETYTAIDIKEALSDIIKVQPHYVFVCLDHPNKKIASIPKLLAQSFPVVVIPFIHSTAMPMIRRIQNASFEYKLFPPNSGPSIQRLIAKITKEERESNANSKKEKGSIINANSSTAKESQLIRVGGNNANGASWNVKSEEAERALNSILSSAETEADNNTEFEGEENSGENNNSTFNGNDSEKNKSLSGFYNPQQGKTSDDSSEGGPLFDGTSKSSGAGHYNPQGSSSTQSGGAQHHSSQGNSQGINSSGSSGSGTQGPGHYNPQGSDSSQNPGSNLSQSEGGSKNLADTNASSGGAQNSTGYFESGTAGGEQSSSGTDSANWDSQFPGTRGDRMKHSKLYAPDSARNNKNGTQGGLSSDKPGDLIGPDAATKKDGAAPNSPSTQENEKNKTQEQLKAKSVPTFIGKNKEKTKLEDGVEDTLIRISGGSYEDGGIEKVAQVSSATCLAIESPKFTGYLVAAFGSQKKIDPSFIALMKQRLTEFLLKQGEPLDPSEKLEIKIKEVDFEAWAIEQADFLKKSVHNGNEIAMAFFPTQHARPEISESEHQEMVQVSIEDIHSDKAVDFNVYIYLPANQKYILYTPKGGSIGGDQKGRLKNRGVTHLHFRKDDVQDFKKYHAEKYLDGKITEFQEKAKKKVS